MNVNESLVHGEKKSKKTRLSMRHWLLYFFTFAILLALLIGLGDLSLKSFEHHPDNLPLKENVSETHPRLLDQSSEKNLHDPQYSVDYSAIRPSQPGEETPSLNIGNPSQNLQDDKNASTFKSVVIPSSDHKEIDSYQTALMEISDHQLLSASERLQSILRIDPQNEDARAVLATLYAERGSIERAETLVTEGLKREPSSVPLNLIYAHFLLLKNQPQDAFKTLKTIENTADNMPEYLELMAFTQAALGHHEEATQDYRFLLSQDPHNQRLLLNLAISLQKSQQNERALVIYQQLESEKNLSPEFKAYISEQLDKLEH